MTHNQRAEIRRDLLEILQTMSKLIPVKIDPTAPRCHYCDAVMQQNERQKRWQCPACGFALSLKKRIIPEKIITGRDPSIKLCRFCRKPISEHCQVLCRECLKSLTEIEKILLQYAAAALRNYHKLTAKSKTLADYGIIRHLRYCRKMNDESFFCDESAIREIVEDAGNGISIAVVNEKEIEEMQGVNLPNGFLSLFTQNGGRVRSKCRKI